MNRQSRVQAPPPPPPYPWPTAASADESVHTPNPAQPFGVAASMQSMRPSAPTGYWSSTGPGSSSVPLKDFSGMDSYPPGGFLSYFTNSHQPLMPHNLHTGGGHPPYAPVMAPQPSMAKSTPHTSHVMIVDDAEDCRTDKRLPWTKDEDQRLFSAWLNNSNDPIEGNCKKGDRYWQDVTATYNNTTPKNRKREINQLKDRFHRVNKKVGWFAASLEKATGIYASGQSDLQLQEKALKFYEEDYKDGEFKYMHCWKAVEGWPKWTTYMQMLDKLKKRKFSEVGEASGDLAFGKDEGIPHPQGNKLAKAERKNKVKGWKDGDWNRNG